MQASHNPDKGAAKKAAVDSVLSQDIVKKCPSRDEWLTDLWIWFSIIVFCSIDEVFVKFEGIMIVVDAGINPLSVTYIDKKFLDLGGMPLIREGNHLWNWNLSLMTDYRLLEPKQTLILSEILMRIVWIHLFVASFSFSNHSNGLEAQPKCPANSLSPSRQWDSGKSLHWMFAHRRHNQVLNPAIEPTFSDIRVHKRIVLMSSNAARI